MNWINKNNTKYTLVLQHSTILNLLSNLHVENQISGPCLRRRNCRQWSHVILGINPWRWRNKIIKLNFFESLNINMRQVHVLVLSDISITVKLFHHYHISFQSFSRPMIVGIVYGYCVRLVKINVFGFLYLLAKPLELIARAFSRFHKIFESSFLIMFD